MNKKLLIWGLVVLTLLSSLVVADRAVTATGTNDIDISGPGDVRGGPVIPHAAWSGVTKDLSTGNPWTVLRVWSNVASVVMDWE